MRVEIKQNPYNAQWTVKPVCAAGKLIIPSDYRTDNNGIVAMVGREWFQRYMRSEFPIDKPLTVDVMVNHPWSHRASALETGTN